MVTVGESPSLKGNHGDMKETTVVTENIPERTKDAT